MWGLYSGNRALLEVSQAGENNTIRLSRAMGRWTGSGQRQAKAFQRPLQCCRKKTKILR